MNSAKSFFFIVFALAASVVQAKPQIVQSDIFYEISQGNTKAVKAWLKLKPDLSVKNVYGQTLLHVAVFAGNRKMVKMLVKAGVLVNALDAAGKTALDLSVESGLVKITYDLVKKKALIACVANEKPLKDLIVKRMTRLYKIFGGIFILGVVIFLVGLFVIPAVMVISPRCSPGVLIYLLCLGSGLFIGSIGMFEVAGLGITSAVRTHRSYLLI